MHNVHKDVLCPFLFMSINIIYETCAEIHFNISIGQKQTTYRIKGGMWSWILRNAFS